MGTNLIKNKVLLLNNGFEVLAFINFKKAIRLMYKEKVDIVSSWDNIPIAVVNGKIMNMPSILKLKYYVKRRHVQLNFSRKAVLRRDKYICSYCNNLIKNQATIDHIVPRSLGGVSSFLNCVAACHPCNHKKGHRTLEQSGLTLCIEPYIPAGYIFSVGMEDDWHSDWDRFIRK